MVLDTEEKADTLRKILSKLLLGRGADGHRQFLTKEDICFLCKNVIDCLIKDGSLVELDPPVVVCGDTHGQFYDLLRLLDHGGWPPSSRYIFLGDYVDRGPQGVEVAATMFALKIAFPNDFFILRGNHECPTVNLVYGFMDECKKRYDREVFWAFNHAFGYLPLAGLIGERIFCMHGGLSPDLNSMDQIRQIERPIPTITTGLTADLLWSDPSPGIQGYTPSNRGRGFLFGEDTVTDFCNSTGIDMIVRVAMDGYEFFAQGRLLTIFSAPKYCN